VNINVKLGLVNGAEGTIVHVKLHNEEQLPAGLFDIQPGHMPPSYHLNLLPESVTVEFDHLNLPRNLAGTTSRKQVVIRQMLSLSSMKDLVRSVRFVVVNFRSLLHKAKPSL